ncbi:glycosyltransferase family 4 protein [Methylotenera sp.]|uniref:glycosyltransferase family 4 protein n=1 Tax=Methylotenera sp. TaxID=2051956 RepID=UPI00248A047E|nr:glycosyltransferase family 4 protein [Methylotenera sp.]MDI1297801.1 glycosyltransferase family 4 protein [Methylotenera sp.]
MIDMRIIHTDTDDLDNPLRGGQPVRTYEINSRLSKNHQITVLTASYKGSEQGIVRSNIHYQRLGITIPGWGLSSHLSYLSRLPAAIKRIPHDLIVEEFTPPFGFCNLQKSTQQPVISIVQWHFFKDWEKRYKLPFEAIMRKRALHFPHRHIIVQTHKMGEYFKALLPHADIYKIPCGINASALQQPGMLGDYALFLGRLDIQHKGLDDLLLAWKMLKEKNLNIPLWIVGAGQDESALKQSVKTLGLSDVVLFKGRLEGTQKNEVLRNCRFLVMPSRQETFGLTALEAMASSKPVIAYDIDHLNELLKPDWSSLASTGDISGFAEHIANYWKDESECLRKGLCAYQEAKSYLWDRLAEAQEQIYFNILRMSQK